MPKGYKRLTQEQRYEIEIMRKDGAPHRTIAATLGVAASTISREIRRNKGERGYRHKQAQKKAEQRINRAGKPLKFKGMVVAQVETLIRQEWSPEQIALHLRQQGTSISHERIYQHIWADKRASGTLHLHLRQSRRKYRKRRTGKELRGHIPNRRSIDERPVAANDRTQDGHWEGDTIIGKAHKGALVSLVERTSRMTLIAAVPSKNADLVANAIITLLAPYKQQARSITFDNGKEFAYHETIAKNLDTDIFFCHPYHSWERGTNENTNGLIRQYFPKTRQLHDVEQHDLDEAMSRLNNRPRKVLGNKTPIQVFSNKCANVALEC